MTALFFLLLIELCLRTGLMPSNLLHQAFFTHARLAMQLTDAAGRTVFASAAVPRATERDIRKSRMELDGGALLWQEDLSLLHERQRQLALTREALSRSRDLLRAEHSIRKQLLPTFLTGEFADPSSLLNRARYRSLNHDEARRLEDRIADGASRIVDALRMIEALEGCSQESPEWAGLFPKRNKQWRTRKFVAETRKRLDGGRSLPATRQEINAVLGEIMERESLRPRPDDLRDLLDDPAVTAELADSLRTTWIVLKSYFHSCWI